MISKESLLNKEGMLSTKLVPLFFPQKKGKRILIVLVFGSRQTLVKGRCVDAVYVNTLKKSFVCCLLYTLKY